MTCPNCKLELSSHHFTCCTHCNIQYCMACIVAHVRKAMMEYVNVPQLLDATKGKPQ